MLNLLPLVLLLAGCANISDPNTVAKYTQVNYDQSTKTTTVAGKIVREIAGVADRFSYRLRAVFKENEKGYVQLYVTYRGQGIWLLLNSANDINGESLPVIRIDRRVGPGASTTEIVAVTLSSEYLVSHQSDGMSIKITGQRGSLVVKVPAAYVAGFLSKLDSVQPKS